MLLQIENKHENDIGEDGFNYYIAFFMDFDGEYYKISFSSAQNANKETVYSIGKVEKRKFPNRHGSSSKMGRSKMAGNLLVLLYTQPRIKVKR